MNKILVSGLAALTLFSAAAASLPVQAVAQTYYPYTGSYGNCINLVGDLSYGSRASDVSRLQTFLVSQNFPGGGSWMITGYFGSATLAAVRSFQEMQGLSQTGVADSATRAAISRVSCGGQSYIGQSSQYYTQNYPYLSYPYNYDYNLNYPYSYGTGPIALTSMSQNTGSPGQSVTLYGNGFDTAGNTVNFGTQVLSGIPSRGGTSLTFIVPQYYSYSYNQTVQITVTNARGTSNALSFTIMMPYGGYGCPSYQYGYPNTNCYQYQQPYNNIQAPVLTYLNPAQGGVGTSVTVFGSGFTTSGNTVHFGNGVIANLSSIDGQSVSFTVPSTLTGFGSQVVTLGTYQVYVTNSAGLSTNSMPFTVTSLGTSVIAPTITSVNGPTTLQAGVQGTWTIKVNNPTGTYLTTSVTWGDEGEYGYAAAQPQTAYVQNQTTLTFTHTYYSAGTRTVSFTVSNASGQSNSSTATVSVSGQGLQDPVTVTSLAPTAGPVGAQVTVYGSGFTYANTVLFGSGAITNVYSPNGTTLTFTVPQYLSPYCAPNAFCAQYVQQVLPGQYDISVRNQNGTSGTLPFQVQ
ncbi:MAG: IPT/TIG domain-containing protein [Patescibacteria group bacterium]|nr:IPT/TIG domain-containing protein [Patescibacteria group bacterium]